MHLLETTEEMEFLTACHRERGVLYMCSGCWEGGGQTRHYVQAQMILGMCTFLAVFPSPVLSLPSQQHGYITLCLWAARTALAVI